MIDECYTYTIMPDYGYASYGWVKYPGNSRSSGNMADAAGWGGDHPISKELEADFATWALEFENDVQQNEDDRYFDWRNYHDRGLALARRLKAELGPEIRVKYVKPAEDPGDAVETSTEILADGSLKTTSGVPLDQIIDLDMRSVPAFSWSEQYTGEQCAKIAAIQQGWAKMFQEPEDRGHYARLQILPNEKHLRRDHFTGIIDGDQVNIRLVVWTLKLEAVRLAYSAALDRTAWRYPGWWEHVYEDGPDVGERRLRFISGTHNLAYPYLAHALQNLCDEGIVPAAVENVEVIPCNISGLAAKVAESEHDQIMPDYHLVRVVLHVDELTDDVMTVLKQKLEQGKTLTVGSSSFVPSYKDIKSFLVELNISELALLNRADARKPVTQLDRKLITACSHLDRQAIEEAIQAGANPNIIDEDETTPFTSLIQAIADHDYLSVSGDTDYDTGRTLPALDAEGKLKICQELFRARANRNLAGFDQLTPIAQAASSEHFELFRQLLNLGADPSLSNDNEYWGEWPTCWDYVLTDSLLGVKASLQMKELLEQKCPTPYWEPCEGEIARQTEIKKEKNHYYEYGWDYFSKEERHFLSRRGVGKAAESAVEYAKAINLLDPEYFYECLTENVVFHDTLESICITWKEPVITHIASQIQAIAVQGLKQRSWAQMGTDSKGQAVILLHRWEETEPYCWIEIEADYYGNVAAIRMVFEGPVLNYIVKSGVYPGLCGVPWQLHVSGVKADRIISNSRSKKKSGLPPAVSTPLELPELPDGYRPTDQQQAYIDSSGDPVNARLCYFYALAFNKLSSGWILNRVNYEVVQQSPTVSEILKGKDKYALHLDKKLASIGLSSNRCYFELGHNPFNRRPCVIGYRKHDRHSSGIGERILWVDIEPDEQGRFKKICIETVGPPLENAESTGLFPGISDETIQFEISRRTKK